MAFLFVVAAVAHAVSFTSEPSRRVFHSFFVIVDVALAALLIARPPWLAPVFSLFAAQQVVAHGWQFIETATKGHFDGISASIVLLMPVTAVALFVERRMAASRKLL